MRAVFLNVILIPALTAAAAARADHELDDRDIAAGEMLYAEHCAACHGADLEGQPDWQVPGPDGVLPAPPHDQTGHTWHHPNALLFDYTRLGGQGVVEKMGLGDFQSGMPAFGEVLTDDQIWEVLAFIASTWPARIADMQATRNPPH